MTGWLSLSTSPFWLVGLLLGMRHALEPDHLAAVSTLVTEQRRGTSGAVAGTVLGTLWGLGHTFALLAVASLLAVAGTHLPDRVAIAFELIVAGMLVFLGTRSLRRAWTQSWRAPSLRVDHGHSTGDDVHADRRGQAHGHAHGHSLLFVGGHVHAHQVSAGVVRATLTRTSVAALRRSLIVGLVHGLAGSGALTALVASRLPTASARLWTVALFGLGSSVGMATLSGVAGWPIARLGRDPRAGRLLAAFAGAVALVLGIFWGAPLVHQLLTA